MAIEAAERDHHDQINLKMRSERAFDFTSHPSQNTLHLTAMSPRDKQQI